MNKKISELYCDFENTFGLTEEDAEKILIASQYEISRLKQLEENLEISSMMLFALYHMGDLFLGNQFATENQRNCATELKDACKKEIKRRTDD